MSEKTTAQSSSSSNVPSASDTLLVEHAVHWAACNGLTMLAKSEDGKLMGIRHCPLTLQPFTLPREAYDRAVHLALPFNVMVDRVSRDTEFLYHVLEGVESSDSFTASLLRISRAAHSAGQGGATTPSAVAAGLRQKVALAINRSDYMLNEADGKMLQVELNTISASFGVLSSKIADLHRFLQARFGQSAGHYLPPNKVPEGIASAIATAHHIYNMNDAASIIESDCTVIFVVQPGETNIADQRPVEYILFEKYGVKVVRLTLTEAHSRLNLSTDGVGRLLLDGDNEVAVVYFRAGYSPNDYPSKIEWDARERIETSLAIKCPSVDFQLVGTKKVQQVLTDPHTLSKFCSPEDTLLLTSCMAGIWALGDSADVDSAARAERAKAMVQPENYVVKPQREGGGNNYYGEDVRRVLKELNDRELSAFILMQRIFPSTLDMTLVRHCASSRGKAICELGIYAPYIGDGERIFHNSIAGHLVRTKFVDVDEGGVASGYACLSSPALTSPK